MLKGHARHPIVEDYAVIYAGARVLGRITIGAGSSIGGNVWLTRSVPANSNITQVQTLAGPLVAVSHTENSALPQKNSQVIKEVSKHHQLAI